MDASGTTTRTPPNALTIASSDPSGGAGIQADLKTFSALGAYGAAVLVALTAQNTHGVSGIHVVPSSFVTQQIDTLFADVQVDAVKIGMLADAEIARTVAAALERHRPATVVLDPVMVASSGDRLLESEAVAVVRDRLLPLVSLVTPNLPEAGDLLGVPQAADLDQAQAHALRLRELGVPRVLVKGGHLRGSAESTDVYADDDGLRLLSAPRVHTKHSHGTGCSLSSAIAALRPRRPDWWSAVRDAKTYVHEALLSAEELRVGSGNGPVHHFHAWWR